MRIYIKTCLAAALSFGLYVGHGTAAFAGAPQSPEKAPETRQFSKEVGAVVNVIVEDYNDGNVEQDRIRALRSLLLAYKLTPYESATIHQMLGSALYETNDFSGAIDAFEHAIASGGLLPKEASNLRLNVAQLLIASGKPAQGAQMLEDWIEDGGEPKPKHVEYLWQAWAQAGQYDKALPWAEKWFETANPKQRKHYDLMNFLYGNLNMTNARFVLLQKMQTLWPDDAGIKAALEEN